MIKILIKENKKLLKEELKYSKTLANTAFKFLKDSTKDNTIKIPIPYNEVSFDTKEIKNGLVFVHLINNLGQGINYVKKFEKYWNANTKSFSENILKQTSGLSFNNMYFKAVHSETPKNIGGRFTFKSVKGSEASIIKIYTYMNNTSSDKDLEGTIIHESQHVTQYINQLAKNYYKQLKTIQSFDELRPEKIEDVVIDVGIGRDPKGIKYSKDMSLEDYYISDDEYETYLTSIVRTCYSYVIKNESYDFDKLSDFTSKFVGKLINNKEFAKQVLLSHGIKNLFDIFQNILHARPKELIRDIKIDLEKMLQSK
jgi:hypothetical protein